MADFLRHLFDTSDFPRRWDCGNWTPEHGWLHVLSDLGVWSAYVAIPLVLGYFVLRRRDIPFRWIFWLFAGFILACGATHLMEALIFWWPAYRLSGVIKLFTAIISWATVIALVPVTPKVLAMRSPQELQREIRARKEAEIALKQANATLESQIEALRSSEERFRLLVDGSKDHAIFMLDPTGHVISWNPGAERMKQYRADEIIGQRFWRFFSADDVEAGKPQRELEVAASEGRCEDEGWRVRKDGSRFWANVVITALRDEQGHLRGFSKITRDLTERMQADVIEKRAAESALRTSEERLRLALDAGKMGVWEWNLQTSAVWWSDRLEQIHGLEPGTFEGTLEAFQRLIHPADRDFVMAAISRAVAARSDYEIEFRIAWPNGSIHWMTGKGKIYCDDSGEPSRMMGVVTDATDWKCAEQELREAEQRLRASELRWRTMAETLPNLVWTDLPDGQCDWLSSQWGKYTGIPESELLGLRWLEAVIHPDDRERTLACWNAACADQGDYDLEYRIRRHDGEYRWFKTRGVPIRDDRGRIVYWFGTCTDIEDVKRMEAALREADHRKNAFLATLAHELRNPLAPLRSGLQILRMTDDRTARDQALEMMERQLAQMIRLIDDLLDISRISCNKLELRKARIPLTSVIESAVETARPLIDSKRQALAVALPNEPVYLDADLTRLAQVFSNILNNSAKYTDSGGQIKLTAQADSTELVVKVQDTGIGIPSGALPGLFTMFAQVEHSLERSQGGLGIGLALVRGLVEMHGGTVEAHSAGVGQGSEFVVRLPIAPDRVDDSKRQTVDSSPAAPRRRVLIVDDNRDGATSLGTMLSLLGHDSRTANDGLEALRVAEDFRPDLILLDIGLPKLNGYDVCRRIRQQPWGKAVFMVALTGWGQQDDRRRSEEAGFDQHIVKPLDTTALRRLLAGLATVSSP